jgi:hypothetical protein
MIRITKKLLLDEEYSSLDDSDLAFAADQLFLELDRHESQDQGPTRRSLKEDV